MLDEHDEAALDELRREIEATDPEFVRRWHRTIHAPASPEPTRPSDRSPVIVPVVAAVLAGLFVGPLVAGIGLGSAKLIAVGYGAGAVLFIGWVCRLGHALHAERRRSQP